MPYSSDMRARTLREIFVYRKAQEANIEISSLLKRKAFSRDLDLKDQLSRSSRRIAPLIAEGYGQLTDRHLAVYLGRARGSVQETIGHLEDAVSQQFVSPAEFRALLDTYDHIGRMLSRWISYLQLSDWKDRR